MRERFQIWRDTLTRGIQIAKAELFVKNDFRPLVFCGYSLLSTLVIVNSHKKSKEVIEKGSVR